MTVLPGGQKIVAVITRLPYYGGGRKAGFHCKRTASTSVSAIRTARKILNANIYYFYPPPPTTLPSLVYTKRLHNIQLEINSMSYKKLGISTLKCSPYSKKKLVFPLLPAIR